MSTGLDVAHEAPSPTRSTHGVLKRSVASVLAVLMVSGGAIVLSGGRLGGNAPSGKTGEFAAAFARTTADFQAKTESVKSQAKRSLGKGIDRVTAVYSSMREAIGDARGRYAALRPPSTVSDDYKRFVALLAVQERSIDQVLEAAKAEENEALIRGLQQLAGQMSEWAGIRNDIATRLTGRTATT